MLLVVKSTDVDWFARSLSVLAIVIALVTAGWTLFHADKVKRQTELRAFLQESIQSVRKLIDVATAIGSEPTDLMTYREIHEPPLQEIEALRSRVAQWRKEGLSEDFLKVYAAVTDLKNKIVQYARGKSDEEMVNRREAAKAAVTTMHERANEYLTLAYARDERLGLHWWQRIRLRRHRDKKKAK